MSGCADSASRAARFGASPTIAFAGRLGPDGIADDDHPGRDTDATAHRRVRIGSQGPDRRAQFQARADRLFSVVLVRLGVTEQDERAAAKIPVHKPVVAIGRLRYAVLKTADRLAQVF